MTLAETARSGVNHIQTHRGACLTVATFVTHELDARDSSMLKVQANMEHVAHTQLVKTTFVRMRADWLRAQTGVVVSKRPLLRSLFLLFAQ